MEYLYESRTPEGEERKGVIDAPSLEAALASLQKRGFIVVRLEPAGKALAWYERPLLLIGGINQRDIVILSRQLATLFEAKAVRHFSARDVEIADVTGAGDTLLAALALGIAAGASLRDACFIANFAAGLVVEKRHTATVSYDELNAAFNEK